MRCSFIIARDLRSAGTIKKERGNPNDSARFIGKVAVTDGETAKTYNYLTQKRLEQKPYMMDVGVATTDSLDDDVKDILKVSGCRWEIEECFRITNYDYRFYKGAS